MVHIQESLIAGCIDDFWCVWYLKIKFLAAQILLLHLTYCIIESPTHTLYREIKILKKLKHKNVIELVEVFDDQEKQKLYPPSPVL